MSNSPSILIVDDDAGLARLIQKILLREGYGASIALTGAEAINWKACNAVDLLLIDLKLPDLATEDLLQKLSTGPEPPPFIIITGQGDERVAVDMMKRGALDYLVKDAQFLELLPIVANRTLAHLASRERLKGIEARLAREYAFSDAVLETSGALMLVVDPVGRIVRFNQACEMATGYTFEEVKGRSFWETFLSEPGQQTSQLSLDELLHQRTPRGREGYLLTKTGERRIVSWSITTIPPADHGEVEFIIASGMDVTERRRLEREIIDIGEQEQKRIGQDLHDGLCQMLAGIDIMATVLGKKLLHNSPADSEAASEISTYARQAAEQARMLARGLSPVELETNGLMSALQELTAMTEKLFGIKNTFVCEHPVLLTDNLRAKHLYRMVQESINNAVKHGHADSIIVSLTGGNGKGTITIRDNGMGIKVATASQVGMGLRSMAHRAYLIGGHLEIKPASPSGTEVTCSFPLESTVSPSTPFLENEEELTGALAI